MIRDGRFVLPGGKDAEAVWIDIIGRQTSERPAFLTALYTTDQGKAAYVVDVFQQLPEAIGRELCSARREEARKPSSDSGVCTRRSNGRERASPSPAGTPTTSRTSPGFSSSQTRGTCFSPRWIWRTGSFPAANRNLRRFSPTPGSCRPKRPFENSCAAPPATRRSGFRRSAASCSFRASSRGGPLFMIRDWPCCCLGGSIVSCRPTRSWRISLWMGRPSRADISSPSTGWLAAHRQGRPRLARDSSKRASNSRAALSTPGLNGS